MQWFFWLDDIYHKMLNSYQINKGHHAVFVHNAWDNGEEVLIEFVVRWLICSCPKSMKYCGICYNCQLMKIQHHPDYYKIELKNDVPNIGVDAVRVCINSVYNHARQSKVKIIFIKFVEYLTDQAVNLLLKILEEPPSNTYFFLYSKKQIAVSSTLLSRCIQWSIVSPTEQVGLTWLIQQQGINSNLFAKCALRLCNGALLSAKDMLKSGFWTQRKTLCTGIYRAIMSGDFLQLVPLLNIHNDNMSLYWLITLIVDTLKYQKRVKIKFLINLDQIKLIKIISIYWDISILEKQLQQWLILFRYFQKYININRNLLLTYRLLNWKHGVVENCLDSWDI